MWLLIATFGAFDWSRCICQEKEEHSVSGHDHDAQAAAAPEGNDRRSTVRVGLCSVTHCCSVSVLLWTDSRSQNRPWLFFISVLVVVVLVVLVPVAITRILVGVGVDDQADEHTVHSSDEVELVNSRNGIVVPACGAV